MSNIGKEFESRIMLTESEYLAVVSHFMRLYPNQQFLRISNTYFDTSDYFLKNNSMTLRLRITNGVRGELTLKIKGSNGDDEINDPLNMRDVDAILNQGIFPDGEVKKRLLSLPYSLDNYKQITTLHNLRLEIALEDHLLVIDKNNYSNITDYNLEVESQESVKIANERLNEYIKAFNLTKVQQKYSGKSHRAIDEAIKNN